MLRYLYADQLHQFPKLRESMFRDRADQFRTRLDWEVDVDANGFECDDYDKMNPLYVIWECPNGSHGGSMRFLPTTGDTMVNDHFKHLTDDVEIRHPMIWECTRFCLSSNAEARVSAALMLGGLEVGLGFSLTDAVGVFDARMERIYRRLGWSPTILGTCGGGKDATSVGLWKFSTQPYPTLLRKSGVSRDVSQTWFDRAFGSAEAPIAIAS